MAGVSPAAPASRHQLFLVMQPTQLHDYNESCAISALFESQLPENEEKCCSLAKTCYVSRPYGYSKEKCILPSRS